MTDVVGDYEEVCCELYFHVSCCMVGMREGRAYGVKANTFENQGDV